MHTYTSYPLQKLLYEDIFPLETLNVCQPIYDREHGYGDCLQKCPECKYCHGKFKVFTLMFVSQKSQGETESLFRIHTPYLD